MRLTVISHSDAFYSTRRLMGAARRLGLHVERIDPIRVAVVAGNDGARVTEDGVELRVPDVVLPRIGARLTPWTLSVLEALLEQGARCAIPPSGIACASDKLSAQLALSRAGIPVLPTVAVREAAHINDALAALPAERWVVKLRHGTGGRGVAIVDSEMSARSVIATLIQPGKTVLVQPFVPTSPTRDLRVLVAGGDALAACWRVARDREFRANVHLGGATEVAEIDDATSRLAVAAAEAVGLPFAGVDLLETPDGFAVLEVNGSPGLEGIEGATKRDLATPFVERFIAHAYDQENPA